MKLIKIQSIESVFVVVPYAKQINLARALLLSLSLSRSLWPFWCIRLFYKIQLNLICFDLLVKVQVVFPFHAPANL